ncbi:GNAT family N-acetyltransferase [Streptacidiphilus sp. EB103A]|uniref:GNAT family N-acetyltransferase n=1 Tax=Streptacidiphilus sp. EB103A TaxID=3156275 RepID=UPI003517475E
MSRLGRRPQCEGGRHRLSTERLTLRTPVDALDQFGTAMGACDADAQHWLGWGRQPPDAGARALLLNVSDRTPARVRRRLNQRLASPPLPSDDDQLFLAALYDADGRYAGAAGVNLRTTEIGGWLAPHFRGFGLGRELFGGAAEFAHDHLGIPVVRAGVQLDNWACRAALASAGFTTAQGPATHTLPDGRVINSRWYEHRSPSPGICGRSPGASTPWVRDA